MIEDGARISVGRGAGWCALVSDPLQEQHQGNYASYSRDDVEVLVDEWGVPIEEPDDLAPGNEGTRERDNPSKGDDVVHKALQEPINIPGPSSIREHEFTDVGRCSQQTCDVGPVQSLEDTVDQPIVGSVEEQF